MDRFRRQLINENAQIKSTCKLCGETITASVSEGLPRFEKEHLQACVALASAPQILREPEGVPKKLRPRRK
jgi:hypothetical protein